MRLTILLLALLFVLSIGVAQPALKTVVVKADTIPIVTLDLNKVKDAIATLEKAIQTYEARHKEAVKEIELWSATRDQLKTVIERVQIQLNTVRSVVSDTTFILKQ